MPLAVLIVNDDDVKARYPGAVSGSCPISRAGAWLPLPSSTGSSGIVVDPWDLAALAVLVIPVHAGRRWRPERSPHWLWKVPYKSKDIGLIVQDGS